MLIVPIAVLEWMEAKMKTCSDCLYYEVCQNRYSWLDQEDNTKYITCEKFKNKADFVEVVRCKDCVKRGTFDCVKSKGDHPTTTKNEEFCCWGERRDT